MTFPVNYNTPMRIIEEAMRDTGLLQRGDIPDSDQLAEYSMRLLDLINVFQIEGLKLWLNTDLPVTMIAGTNLYTLGPSGNISMIKPLRVIQSYVIDPSGNTRPLLIISRDEWSRLSNKNQQGAINSVFVDKQQLSLNIYLWLTPDSTAALDTLHLVIQQQITNFTGLTDALNFPVEWFLALRWALADDISSGQPIAVQEKCAKRAMYFKTILEDWDVEDASTLFSPNSMSGAVNSSKFI
jgi:hypothetical protein